MTREELYTCLSSGRIYMEERDAIVEKVIAAPELIGYLYQLVLDEDKTEYWHCSWVFDTVMRKNINLLLPHITIFCAELKSLKSESVIRPMAHICELLTVEYFKKKNTRIQHALKTVHLEQMAEVCFDWLIANHKVATKVFAMTSLFYLGEKFEWIRPELKSVLEQQIASGSAAFKSRGSKTLEKLKKLGY